MSALRRVLRAPWLWLTVGLVQLALAAAVAAPLRAVLRAAMGPFMFADETRVLTAVLELATAHPTVIAAFSAVMIGSVSVVPDTAVTTARRGEPSHE